MMSVEEKHEQKEIDFYIKVLSRLAKAVYIYCFENKPLGRMKIEQALLLLEDLGSSQLRHFYERRLLETIAFSQ